MKSKMTVLVGTYTVGSSEGIAVFDFDSLTGELTPVSVCKVRNPTYITQLNKHTHTLYSVSENETGRSYANAFSFNSHTKRLTLINRRVTKGAGPCHIVLDPLGKFIVTANYAGGSINVFPINPKGALEACTQSFSFGGKGENPERQEASHPHCVAFSKEGKYLFVTDLGTDRIYRFTVNYSGGKKFLNEKSRKDFVLNGGLGPRHLVFSEKGNFLYVINELKGYILTFRYHQGELIQIQEIPIDNLSEEGGGGIVITPDGNFLLATMREGNDGIAVFRVNTEGKLIPHLYCRVSEHPRDLALSPDGQFVLITAMKDHLIEVMKRTPDGFLEQARPLISMDSPAFIRFLT